LAIQHPFNVPLDFAPHPWRRNQNCRIVILNQNGEMKRLFLCLPLLLVVSPPAALSQSKEAICAERDAELVEMGKQSLDEAYQAFNAKWWKRLGIQGRMPSSAMEAFIAISSFCSDSKK
jgi:hypothetical protein